MHTTSKMFFKAFFSNVSLFPILTDDWMVFDFSLKKDSFELNGVTFIDDSIPNPHNFIKNIDPKKVQLDKIVPANFKSFLTYPIETKTIEYNFKKWALFKNIPIQNINLNFLEVVDEIGWIEINNEKMLVFHIKNRNKAQEKFIDPNKKIETYRNVSIHSTQIPTSILTLSKSYNNYITPKYVAFFDEYVVFGKKIENIKQIILNYQNKITLNKNNLYIKTKNDLASKSSFLWIGNNKILLDNQPIKNKEKFLKKYPLSILQSVGETNFAHLYFTIPKNHFKNYTNELNKLTLILDSSPASTPQWIKNHRTKKMDAIVQDKKNQVYLFANNGNFFWKKKLSSPIQGKITQVDLYKNARLQMAFCTQKEFLILDRNGEIVPPFNIQLPKAKKTNPLAVFDYDLKKKYRFLLTQDKSIFMYDRKGKIVKGFLLKNTPSEILKSPKHFRIKNLDYIVFPQKNGTLSILNRKGQTRIKIKEKINFSNNEIYNYLNTFTTTDKSGNLLQINTNNKVLKTKLNIDINNKINATSKSLVTLSENILNINGVTVELPKGNYTYPKIFYINNIIYISTTDLKNEKVYLFYSSGKALNGFPVTGNSPIDLAQADSDPPLELIVNSNKKEVFIYELNEKKEK